MSRVLASKRGRNDTAAHMQQQELQQLQKDDGRRPGQLRCTHWQHIPAPRHPPEIRLVAKSLRRPLPLARSVILRLLHDIFPPSPLPLSSTSFANPPLPSPPNCSLCSACLPRPHCISPVPSCSCCNPLYSVLLESDPKLQY